MSAIDHNRKAQHARREQRFAVDLAAMIRSDQVGVEVRLLDLSRGGALATCSRPPPLLSMVTLLRGALTIEARVVWAGRSRFGLEFVRPIRATELLVQLSQSRASLA